YLFPPFAGTLLELPAARDALLLLVLALACTLLPFALSLVALRHMSAFAAQLAVNLEPVYAIVLAILLLGEQRELTPLFYLGVLIILGAVFVYALLFAKRGAGGAQPEHPEARGTPGPKQLTNRRETPETRRAPAAWFEYVTAEPPTRRLLVCSTTWRRLP